MFLFGKFHSHSALRGKKLLHARAGLPDFSWSKHTKTVKYTKWTQTIPNLPYVIPYGQKLYQTNAKYTYSFHSKAL
jgi:hypothetical protein